MLSLRLLLLLLLLLQLLLLLDVIRLFLQRWDGRLLQCTRKEQDRT
jgi:hypothetical protein